jgi:hypothetical protein
MTYRKPTAAEFVEAFTNILFKLNFARKLSGNQLEINKINSALDAWVEARDPKEQAKVFWVQIAQCTPPKKKSTVKLKSAEENGNAVNE